MLVVLSITLMTLDQRTDYVRHVRAGIAVIVYPLQYVVSLPANFLDWTEETLASRESLQVQNADLRRENQALRGQWDGPIL